MKWPVAPLFKIVRIVGGGTPAKANSTFWSGEIPWVSPKDMLSRDIWETQDHISENAIAESATQLVPAGSVLIVARSGILARFVPIAIARVPVTLNQDMKAFLPTTEALDNQFLAYFLESRSPELLASFVKRGATVHSLDMNKLQQLQVPIPASLEQRRIVEILDQANALRRKRAEADAKGTTLLLAIFYKMFGDPSTNPKGLKKQKLGDLITVRSGNFLPEKNMDANGMYPVYGGNGINGYHSKYMFEDRIIVIGRVGVYCGAIHYSEPKSWVTDNALYVAKMSKDLRPQYLEIALKAANLNQYAGRAGQPLISGSRIYPVEVLVPQTLKQEQFSCFVEKIESIKDSSEAAGQKVELIFSALLYRAFSGELTATWREGHMKELLAEMKEQAKYFGILGPQGQREKAAMQESLF